MALSNLFMAPEGLRRGRLSQVWGDLSPPEGEALRASIHSQGVLTPILVDLETSEILDGWHRYIHAQDVGQRCPARDAAGLSVGQRIALVEAGNAHRRHQNVGELVRAIVDTRLDALGPGAEVDTGDLADRYELTRRRVQQIVKEARAALNGLPAEDDDADQDTSAPPTVEEQAQEAEASRLLGHAAAECGPTLGLVARELRQWGGPGRAARRRVVAAGKALGLDL